MHVKQKVALIESNVRFTLPGLCDSEELSTTLLAAINVFQNRVEFPQEFIVWELFLHGLRLQCLQLVNCCGEKKNNFSSYHSTFKSPE